MKIKQSQTFIMRIKKNLIFQLIFLSFFSSQIEARESVDSLNLLKSDESQSENKLSGLKFKGEKKLRQRKTYDEKFEVLL